MLIELFRKHGICGMWLWKCNRRIVYNVLWFFLWNVYEFVCNGVLLMNVYGFYVNPLNGWFSVLIHLAYENGNVVLGPFKKKSEWSGLIFC